MGNFIESNLIPGEKLIYKAAVHWMVYFPAALNIFISFIIFYFGKYHFHMQSKILPILAAIPLVVAAFKTFQAYLHREFTEIGVTNDRLIAKFGWISRETIELPLTRIESVIVEQSISERIIGAGSIMVRGTGVSMAPISYIEEPFVFRNRINEAINEAKNKNQN